jgi:DNA polymerase III delta subunit
LQINPDAAALLADLIGNDLGRLDNELAKLALRSTDSTIRSGDIAGTVAFQREQAMWHMTDALSTGNLTEALRRWRHLVQMDPSTEFRAVTWLGMWLENVRKALRMRAGGVPDEAIAKACRIWDAQLRGPFFRTVEQLGHQGVDRAIDLLIQADRRSKSGLGDAQSNVERFMLSLK